LSFRYISFLTDFGAQDEFVGVCHGVIHRIAGEVTVIDVTHGIPPQDVAQGAAALARALPYLPVAVHLAVVDPGVGGDRRPVAVRTHSGSILVGPDNGLLVAAAEHEGIEAVRVLTNGRLHLEPVSNTFHARDLFSPVAAHLAAGVPFDDLGAEVPPQELVRLTLPAPRLEGDALVGQVTGVDRFGNLASNIVRPQLDGLGLAAGDAVAAVVGGASHAGRFGETYADVGDGELVVLEDSSGAIALAVRNGSAARLTGASAGDELRISRR
jgi:hypothetical protein